MKRSKLWPLERSGWYLIGAVVFFAASVVLSVPSLVLLIKAAARVPFARLVRNRNLFWPAMMMMLWSWSLIVIAWLMWRQHGRLMRRERNVFFRRQFREFHGIEAVSHGNPIGWARCRRAALKKLKELEKELAEAGIEKLNASEKAHEYPSEEYLQVLRAADRRFKTAEAHLASWWEVVEYFGYFPERRGYHWEVF